MKAKIKISIVMAVAFWLFHVTVGDFYSIARQPEIGELGMAQLQDSNSAYSNSLWEIYVMNGLNANTLGFLTWFGKKPAAAPAVDAVKKAN